MATECFLGTFPLQPDTTLPLPSARCTPENGICYSSLSRGGGQATAQLGCWPRQASGQLAWLGVPECKNEVERLVCLCLETLCNGFVPSSSEIVPEGGDLQGIMMLFLFLLLVSMLAGVISCVYKIVKKQIKDTRTELLENGENDSYMQQETSPSCSGHQCPRSVYPQYPLLSPSPWLAQNINQCPPAPLIRMASAPARLKRSSKYLDNLVIRSEVDGLEDILIGFRSNSKTKPVKRLDLGGFVAEGNDNLAFSITKIGPVLKNTGKVTDV